MALLRTWANTVISLLSHGSTGLLISTYPLLHSSRIKHFHTTNADLLKIYIGSCHTAPDSKHHYPLTNLKEINYIKYIYTFIINLNLFPDFTKISAHMPTLQRGCLSKRDPQPLLTIFFDLLSFLSQPIYLHYHLPLYYLPPPQNEGSLRARTSSTSSQL